MIISTLPHGQKLDLIRQQMAATVKLGGKVTREPFGDDFVDAVNEVYEEFTTAAAMKALLTEGQVSEVLKLWTGAVRYATHVLQDVWYIVRTDGSVVGATYTPFSTAQEIIYIYNNNHPNEPALRKESAIHHDVIATWFQPELDSDQH